MGFQFSDWEDVSVVIPAYNAEETILRALHSIASQSVKAREIIVVDGGSTDNTIAVVEKEAAMEGWITPIRLIKSKSSGPSKARNIGVKKAEGAYIAFLDADDEWHPQKLSRSMQELRKSNATIVAHDVIHQYPLGRKFYREHSKMYLKKPFTKLSLFLFDYVNHSTVIVDKNAIIQAGGFDETSTFDAGYDLWLKILNNPENSLHFFKGALVTYYIQGQSLSSQYLKKLACHEKYIIRHAHAATFLSYALAPVLSIIRCIILTNKVCNRASNSNAYERILISILRMPYALVKVATLSIIPLNLFTKKR
ncbi:MAG: hypothetical protein CMF61_04730 [Magnetococcales bacterium]|jgi:glycosyltransferase involved in cell wall biosynthesis|nr:hypothetical protein [Magnetococcales bacterium]